MWYCMPGGNAALNWEYGETLELKEQKKLKCEHLIHPSNQILTPGTAHSVLKCSACSNQTFLVPFVLHYAVHRKFKTYGFFLVRHWSAWELKCHNDEARKKNGSQIQGQSSWFDALSNQKSNPALLHSAHSVSRNPALRYEMALHTPIRLTSPTSHCVAFYLLSQKHVQPLSFKASISGALTWQRGGFLSSELGIKASGVMCQLALFYRGSLCVLSGGVKAWADSFYLGAGEMIQIFQNGIIAAGIPIACQGFLCVEVKKKKKGFYRGNRLFCLLLYTLLSAFRTSQHKKGVRILHAHVVMYCTACFHVSWTNVWKKYVSADTRSFDHKTVRFLHQWSFVWTELRRQHWKAALRFSESLHVPSKGW